MLQISDLNVFYGKVHAVKGISMTVNEGEIVSLLGSNGAGKSSILKTVSGLVKPSEGQIVFCDKDLNKIKPYKRVNEGIGYVPEGRRIYSVLTVKENLMTGAYHRKDRKGISEDLKSVYEYFPILQTKRNELAGNLSGGQQQMVAVGRALMTRPKFMILDEPSMGLAPSIVEQIFDIITTLRDEGITILLVEQNAFMALNIANRAYILETGKMALDGKAEELKANTRVKEIYLGM